MKHMRMWLAVFLALGLAVAGTVPAVGQAAGRAASMPGAARAAAPAQECPDPLAGLEISGPAIGYVGLPAAFVGIVAPPEATLPITYTWSPEPVAGQGTSSASYAFATPGTHVISLDAVNCGGGATDTLSIQIRQRVFLPVIMKPVPPPLPPTLNAIDNVDGDGFYTVSWSASAGATQYTLQEDDNAAFTSPASYLVWPATSWLAAAKSPGTYYYRVNASSSWGTSAWSNVQPATVNPVWETLVSTDFEAGFGAPWIVFDNDGATGGEYFWARSNCRVSGGSYSGWAVGGGANGSLLPCGSNYPDNADSWMVFGPFSLAGATAGELNYQLWLNSEYGYDAIGSLASIDGSWFYGDWWTGTSGAWVPMTFDLSDVYTLGNLMGQPQVYVALVFLSDGDTNLAEGAYVDDVVLRRYLGSAGDLGVKVTPALPAGLQRQPGSRLLER